MWPDHEVPGCARCFPGSFYKFPKTFLLTDCWRFENTPSIGGNVAPPCSITNKCKNVLTKTNTGAVFEAVNSTEYSADFVVFRPVSLMHAALQLKRQCTRLYVELLRIVRSEVRPGL